MSHQTQGRNTKVKQLVAYVFQNTPEPISLRDVFKYVKLSLPKTSYSTVFRIVTRLKEEKQIHAVDWRERGSRYEWSGLPHHHHIVCQLCGRVTDLDDADLKYDEKYIQKKTGYLTKHHSIELEGICAECQKKH
jgi:Fur family ferric uptake transcriptional regulator